MDVKSFITGALLGGSLAAVVHRVYSREKGERSRRFLDEALLSSSHSMNSKSNELTPDITAEQFVRNEQFFGEDGQGLVRKSRIVVVGLGGVGSHCAVTLARSGVGSMRLIDFDRVTVSSLNRHASAVRSEVGLPKVLSLKRFITLFSPDCEVDAVEALFNYESAKELLLDFRPDWVIDAIDNLHTKADLIAFCHENKLPVISACGSAAKCDPTRIRISTLENSTEDSLARALRQRLRLQRGLTNTGIPVVYSTERTTRGLLPLKDFQEQNPKEFQALDKFRVRILPVIAPLPAIMGNAIASYILCQLAQQPFQPLTAPPIASASHRKKLWNFARRNFGASGPKWADSPESDLILDIVNDACSGRSIVSGESANLCLVPYIFDNTTFDIRDLVLMTTNEAKNHLSDYVDPFSNLEGKISQVRERICKSFIENGIEF